jgi:hypothetical protein
MFDRDRVYGILHRSDRNFVVPFRKIVNTNLHTSIENSSQSSNIDNPSLSDNLQDTPWDKHRRFADRVMSHYAGSKFDRYAERIALCSQLLEFDLKAADDNTNRLQLRSARFCRVRHPKRASARSLAKQERISMCINLTSLSRSKVLSSRNSVMSIYYSCSID